MVVEYWDIFVVIVLNFNMIIKDYDTANESFKHIELAFVVFFYFLHE